MTDLPPRSDLPGHQVENQPLGGWSGDLWAGDLGLREAAEMAGANLPHLAEYGARMGSDAMRQAGREANRHLPELFSYDRFGRRLDEVRFHPAYHDLMQAGATAGYAAIAWDGTPGGHATHAAMVYLHSQIEPGTCCPLTMTYAAYPVLSQAQNIAAEWQPRLTARAYDPRAVPVDGKTAVTLGMAMTEKQGGSDLRANSTRADPIGDHYHLTGHKWFCSAPMSDGFLTLAQAPGGLSCFIVPRWLETRRNPIRITRLKDKLGNRANASAEIEYEGALAWRIGDEGAGIRTILEMVQHTRLDTALAPAGLMRAALAEAVHWARHRAAFQRKLIDQPLMRAVLADCAITAEASLWLGLYVARAFDRADPADRALARIGVALAKYSSNKACPNIVYEAMEALGGMGYVEDTPLPMLYREAPLNSIWEGSGNIICLDVLRALARDPLTGAVLTEEIEKARGSDIRFDQTLAAFQVRWPRLPSEPEARYYTEMAARLLTAAILIRHAPVALAEGYLATAMNTPRGTTAGALPAFDVEPILSRFLLD